ncbi:PP2C family protein-serine/threonine phosphatase [Chamaesiphon minutus]|uniref:Serine/threonine protein phosphatase n=1 Tax=Chamaesiphon minutus (strain ATCC 27169 / PCC 6605) TaxID=1173020 RepID=K9UG37_CHAP6|nr:protein phosphatase 2C domain-containing protein [Chamaesiphon minutus]AFY94082.1 serine/threonine protein phosphatase [Chamaesiphon minutus PCC 6605]
MTTAQPVMSRYLWAAERQATWIPADRLVEDRYHVIAPQLWLDTKPQEPPDILSPLPRQALAYAHLYQYKLHLPQLHGFCSLKRSHETIEIPLLENVPIDSEGKLLPSLLEAWSTATPLYQAYWLWQAIDLWAPLAGTGVLSSLVVMDNLRVDGWCLRLCELIPDYTTASNKVTLAKLGTLWLQALGGANLEIADRLTTLFMKMEAERVSLRDVSAELNRIAIEQAALLPLAWQIAGGTDAGASYEHNEDSYYPTPLELAQDITGGKIAIICDGVAGHEGGEVASQMAVKLLKIETQLLLQELINSQEIVPPEQICNTIGAIVRVVNNTITAQNQTQGREDRRRMGTTMVMALQVNQRIPNHNGVGNSHEIYIAHVGDSRAYWITPHRCQLLTLDDDIATREVKQGRDVPWHSANRPDATALTQALGMKPGELIRPTVQRFMAIEDGILLLCSDGLSDRNLVERSWQEYADRILQTDIPLTEAVQSWLALAHRQNGDDNISLVLMSCQVSTEKSRLGSQLVALGGNRLDRENRSSEGDSGATPQFALSRFINLFLWITTSIGLLAAIAIAIAFFYPDWVENMHHQFFPDRSSQIEQNRSND